MNEFTATDKLKCVQRELMYRRRVYPRLGKNGQITDGQAREIALMESIVADYDKLASKERLI